MPKITYIAFDGKKSEVEADEGTTVMQAAVENLIAGIDGDCGGACACATCHVMVTKEWADRLAPVSDDENMMLDMVPDRQETSRLGCQLEITSELDGIVVHMPEAQH